jgi:hypothetical protein
MELTGGNTYRENIINDSKRITEALFEDDASANLNIIHWKDNAQVKCRIYDEKTVSKIVTASFQVLKDSTLDIGDIIYDTKENKYWLCIEIYNIGDIIKEGKIQLCNFTIKFQSSDGTILSYPCISTNRIQGTGDKESDIMTLPDGRKKVVLPCDENTLLLRNDDRFYLDKHPTEPRPYRITFVDTTALNYGEKGLIEIYCVEDQAKTDDRPDLGICDYFEPNVNPPTPIDTYSTLKASGALSVGGSKRTITPTFYNADGSINDTIVPIWVITKPVGYDSDIIVSYVDKTCTIQVLENYDLLGKVINISVSDGIGGYVGELELSISIGY